MSKNDNSKNVREEGNYVRMHLLHFDLGGKATDSNLVPAKSAYNNAFYRAVEKNALNYIKNGDNTKTSPPYLIWYSVIVNFYSGADTGTGINLSGYPKSVVAEYGKILPNNGKYEKVKNKPGINIYDSNTIPPPEFASHLILTQMTAKQIKKINYGGKEIGEKVAILIANKMDKIKNEGDINRIIGEDRSTPEELVQNAMDIISELLKKRRLKLN